MSTPHTGEELIGSQEEVNGYRFERILGRDVAGRLVFRAVNYKHQKRAVKIISLIPITVMDIAFNEAILITDVKHLNIADAFEFMVRKQNTQLLIFTEYCDQNLARNFKTIPDIQLVKCALGILDAMVYIHEIVDISHSDVRMESVQLIPKNSSPKITFYSIDWENEVPRDCYLTKQLLDQFQEKGRINELTASKADDLWALGILLLELFSKRRITQILGLDPRNKYQICKQVYGGNKMMFQSLKFTKIRELCKKLLNPNPKLRPQIGQFAIQFRQAIKAPDFSIIKQLVRGSDAIREQKVIKLKPSVQKKKAPQEKYEQIIQRTSRRTNADAFRLDDAKDKTKLKILNFSSMKIIRIEPINNLPNLEWLYLEQNQIRKIQNLDYARLKGLHLASNYITKIEGLDRLTSLQQLYLDKNQITKIENLEELRNLKWLYLNHNKITIIENLEHLKALKTVALRQNPIDQFKKENGEAIRQLKKENVEVYLQ